MVNLVSSFPSVEPTHSVTRYDQSQRKKVQVTQTDIVHVYNQYMGGVDKLYICMLYKPSLRTRRWYIYIWLHPYRCSKCLVFVPTWFKICKPNVKFIQLKQFLAHLAQSLVRTVQPVSRQSLNKFQTPQKKQLWFKEIQQNMFEKMAPGTCQFTIIKGSVVYIVRYRFPISAANDAMFGFVETITETASNVFMKRNSKCCEVNISYCVLSWKKEV